MFWNQIKKNNVYEHQNLKGTDVKIQGQIAYRQNDRTLQSDEEFQVVKEPDPAVPGCEGA